MLTVRPLLSMIFLPVLHDCSGGSRPAAGSDRSPHCLAWNAPGS